MKIVSEIAENSAAQWVHAESALPTRAVTALKIYASESVDFCQNSAFEAYVIDRFSHFSFVHMSLLEKYVQFSEK